MGQHSHGQDQRPLEIDPLQAQAQIAPILEGLGDHHHAITTKSERAQLFFDQGLRLAYGFNHLEALRAFKEAVRLDPDCAMAYWGWALVLGPNLNLPMRPEVVQQAHEAIQMAMQRREKVSEPEREYIEALANRYSNDPKADRAPLDLKYANAMKALHERYPTDDDAATLYAASLMNLSPWGYWYGDGQPRARTAEILEVLEETLARTPRHVGALHYYIHAVEAVSPKRAEAMADRLRGLTPGAGHLVHMPSHIYIQVGRYQDAFAVNVDAVKADEGYITQCRAQGIYPLNYYPHNLHFLVWAALMQGRSQESITLARKLASRVPADFEGNDWALYQTFLSMPLYAMVRFGKWQEILKEPPPSPDRTYWRGIWHYARALAYLRQSRAAQARRELAALSAIADDHRNESVLIGFTNGARLLRVAMEVVAGEIDAAARRYDRAIAHLDTAVRLQDSLTYTEPPDWYYPVRQTLGAVLLEAGRPAEAEVVYWADLRQYPENGYSLRGLVQALRDQGREDDAAAMQERFRRAWSHSDVQLISSRF
jgi:tetratricopeptide (TPR) repeat protein